LALAEGRNAAQPPTPPPPGAPAVAPGDEDRDAQGIPAAYRKVEFIDRTTGMRDDTFWSINVGKDGPIYIGTIEGRGYISHDNGDTWVESWIIPEVKQLWVFGGQPMNLGKVRNDNVFYARTANLLPGWGMPDNQWALEQWSGVANYFVDQSGDP